MKKLQGLAALALFVVACADATTAPRTLPSDGPNLAAVVVTQNDQIPFALVAFVPCANGGVGENVSVQGTLHVTSHLTVSNSGRGSVKAHFQPQGATGTGLTTGDVYRSTGVTQDRLNVDLNDGLPVTTTAVNNFRLIGPGPNNNLLVHSNVHLTVNANGTVTATVDNFSVECR